MKTTITSILTFFALPLLAQVTIDQSSFPRPAGFVETTTQAAISGVAVPTEGASQSWDYSALTSIGTSDRVWIDASGDQDYPTALNYRNVNLTFQVFGMRARQYEAVDTDGWYDQGRYIIDTTHSITAISGGANDVLNFPDQVDSYDGRLNTVKFPASFNDTWSEGYVTQVEFNLTVQGFGLNNAPGIAQTTVSQTRTVVGDGTLVIPDGNGNPSGVLDAILIKVENRMEIDSFFLGGQLAPAPLLSAFGLTQGEVSEFDDFYVFYTPNFPTTVLNVNLNSSGGVSSVYYKPEAASLASSIGNELSFNAMRTYPNPIAAGDVMNIELMDQTDAASVELIDMTGRQVLSASIATGSGMARIALPTNLEGGIYSMVVRSADTSVLSTGKLLVN